MATESLNEVSINLLKADPHTWNKYSRNGGILNREDVADNMSQVVGSYDYDNEYLKNIYFNRYRHIYPGDEIKSGKKYCFIVKPDLNIPEAVLKDPYFANLFITKPYVLQSLTHVPIGRALEGMVDSNAYLKNSETSHFISFLSDRAMSFALPDFNVQEYKLDQPFTGFGTSYAGNANEVRTNQSTQIQFRDTNNLDVLSLFDAWIRYIDMVSYGVICPYRDYSAGKLMYGTPIIDYATSIYEIITKSDGTEIIYWAKITGTFPTTVPHSNYQFNFNDEIDNEIEIQFSGGLPETLNPRIFADFNYNANLFTEGSYEIAKDMSVSADSLKFVPHARYGYENLMTPGGSSIVGTPYITFNNITKKYYLRWLPREAVAEPYVEPVSDPSNSVSWYGDYGAAQRAGLTK